MRISIKPDKADAPLVIDANAVGPRAVTFQKFQLVSGGHTKIPKPDCPIQVEELPPRCPLDGLKSPNHVVLEQRRGV
jgi:hypothetical protein